MLGVRLERTRLLLLGGPPADRCGGVARSGWSASSGWWRRTPPARSSVGRNARVLPVAALLGALLVSLADTLGRTVIAPAQIPAGLLTALVGAPYFVWLLWRSRAAD